MSLLCFQNARLIDPEEGTDALGTVLVENGIISVRDPETVPSEAEIIECNGKCRAPGIVDVGVKIGEPGERHKESFKTAGRAAAAGGVTTMVTRADTTPPVDTPEVLDFVKRRAREVSRVRIAPLAALPIFENAEVWRLVCARPIFDALSSFFCWSCNFWRFREALRPLYTAVIPSFISAIGT